MNRRHFLLYSAWLAAPLASAATSLNDTFGLIIVGAGAAGLTCACVAAEEGIKNIVVFEKNPVIGGSSIISRGSWLANGTSMQKQEKIEDSDSSVIRDMLAEGLAANDEKILRASLPANREQMAWFEKNGIKPNRFFAEKNVKRVHRFDMPDLIFFLRQKALSLGVKIQTGCAVNDLILNDAKSRVIGVKYTKAGTDREAYSPNGVVLCSGGFTRNKDLLARFAPGLENVATIAPQGLTGDGLLMAMRAGAAIQDTGHLKASYAFLQNPSSYEDMTFAYYYGPIIVNSDCSRFVSESAPYKDIAQKVVAQLEAKSALVFDENIRKTVAKIGNENNSLSTFWRTGKTDDLPIFKGNTIEEVAQNAHMDPVGLKDTVDMYNHSVEKLGEDPDFYRQDLSGQGRLAPISKPPFYILPVSAVLLGTYGGLKINNKGQVLNKVNKPIEGLWAAGEIVGGVHGANAVMGAPLAAAFGLGRITAKEAAKEARSRQ